MSIVLNNDDEKTNISLDDIQLDEFELEDEEQPIHDDNWISEYISKEKIFNKFYKENVDNIQLFFLYVDTRKNIIKVIKNKIKLENNVILKENLSEIIEKNRIILKKRFKLTQLLKYNFNIDNEDVNKFLKTPDDFQFLTKINKIKDVFWDNTIPLFSSLNSLYFIFVENIKHKTKKIYLKKKRSKTKKNKYNKELKIEESDIIKIDKNNIIKQ
tara:strand:- start:3903 stop:4544 length:642 start_codon:yes stop_codon:yes gene_type:complete